jgi:hypothetical protein
MSRKNMIVEKINERKAIKYLQEEQVQLLGFIHQAVAQKPTQAEPKKTRKPRKTAVEDAAAAIHEIELRDLRSCLSSPGAKPAEDKPKGTRKPRKAATTTTTDAPPAENKWQCEAGHRFAEPQMQKVRGQDEPVARCPECGELAEKVA